MSPVYMDKLKAAFNDVAPDSPDAAPVLEALNAFLGRWFGVGLDDVVEFRTAAMTKPEDPKAKTTFDVELEAPCGEKLVHSFDIGFEGFGVDGLLTLHLTEEVAAASRAVRFEEECNQIEGTLMEIGFGVTKFGDRTWEKVYIRQMEEKTAAYVRKVKQKEAD